MLSKVLRWDWIVVSMVFAEMCLRGGDRRWWLGVGVICSLGVATSHYRLERRLARGERVGLAWLAALSAVDWFPVIGLLAYLRVCLRALPEVPQQLTDVMMYALFASGIMMVLAVVDAVRGRATAATDRGLVKGRIVE